MRLSASNEQSRTGPNRRQKHYSYDESPNESPQLLEDEPVDIEHAVPMEQNEPVENIEDSDENDSEIFEEGVPDRDQPRE